MKYFYDTEFIEDGTTIDLISIGIQSEDGREYYAISTEFDETKASDWVKENVLAKLETNAKWYRSREEIRKEIVAFIGEDKPELWAYYADYDHIALCQLFGTMMDLPDNFPMYTRDIKQLCDSVGNPQLPEQGKGEHNALDDAKWNQTAHEFLHKKQVASMVERFCGWKLPEDFHPDAGITFEKEFNVSYNANQGKPPSIHEPVGTNLFTADQAEEMMKYALGISPCTCHLHKGAGCSNCPTKV